MKKMDLIDISSIRAGSLSGGQRQRVALARALAGSPSLLMLDEPFISLDAQSTVSVKNAICRYVAELQIPCLMVTHRMDDAHQIGDRICILSKGRNVWEGKPVDAPLSGGHR
jgi:ABC-type sulfate/molybdate transport systems ATPase subunit